MKVYQILEKHNIKNAAFTTCNSEVYSDESEAKNVMVEMAKRWVKNMSNSGKTKSDVYDILIASNKKFVEVFDKTWGNNTVIEWTVVGLTVNSPNAEI